MSERFVTAILLAAGRGERLGGNVMKQFLDLAGLPMLLHSLRILASAPAVNSVVAVVPEQVPDDIDLGAECPKLVALTNGGQLRQDSLAQGIICLPSETELVLVHDAARPLVSAELINVVIAAASHPFQGAIPVISEEDAIKEVSSEGEVLGFRSKKSLKRAQTPQAFLREPLEDALARVIASGELCEDCSEMLSRAGYRIRVVPGDRWNIKVTEPSDLGIAEKIIAWRASR